MLSRRNFVVSAATASAVFGLNGPIEFITPASAQKAAPGPRTFKTFKLGDLQVTTVYDGIWEKPHDAGFIKNASVEDTKKALAAAKLTDEFVPITFTVTLIKRGNDYVMFDSSTGGQLSPKAGQFLENLKAAGIDKDKIKTVVLTHYHGDHILGLMTKDNVPLYPNAEIIAPAVEHKYWSDPSVTADAARRIQATLSTWKNVKTFEGEKEVTKNVRAIAAHGHTPGHTAYLVSSGRNQMIVSADTTNIPALFVRNPGWHVQFDMDAAAAEATRRKLFDRAVSDGVVVTGYHWGIPGAGKLKKDGKGYVYLPV